MTKKKKNVSLISKPLSPEVAYKTPEGIQLWHCCCLLSLSRTSAILMRPTGCDFLIFLQGPMGLGLTR